MNTSNSKARPRFSWPKLGKAIKFYERERLCYLPAGWGRKSPRVEWEGFQNRLPLGRLAQRLEHLFHTQEVRASSALPLTSAIDTGVDKRLTYIGRVLLFLSISRVLSGLWFSGIPRR